MSSVLGIDSAWSTKNASGIALIQHTSSGRKLIRASSSCDDFLNSCGIRASDVPANNYHLNVDDLLRACAVTLGTNVSLVAVDMPLSHEPITCRRNADDAVSKAYGAFKAATHSPSSERPGKIADTLVRDFATYKYRLCTSKIELPGLIEVYPHPALIKWSSATERLKYKVTRQTKFWPEDAPPQRRMKLCEVWNQIIDLLESYVQGVRAEFRVRFDCLTTKQMKAFEDKLDAIICACIGMCAIDGYAEPFGNDVAAIWVPTKAITGCMAR